MKKPNPYRGRENKTTPANTTLTSINVVSLLGISSTDLLTSQLILISEGLASLAQLVFANVGYFISLNFQKARGFFFL